MDLSDGQTPTYSTAVLKENESTTQKKILFFQKLLSQKKNWQEKGRMELKLGPFPVLVYSM